MSVIHPASQGLPHAFGYYGEGQYTTFTAAAVFRVAAREAEDHRVLRNVRQSGPNQGQIGRLSIMKATIHAQMGQIDAQLARRMNGLAPDNGIPSSVPPSPHPQPGAPAADPARQRTQQDQAGLQAQRQASAPGPSDQQMKQLEAQRQVLSQQLQQVDDSIVKVTGEVLQSAEPASAPPLPAAHYTAQGAPAFISDAVGLRVDGVA